MVSWFNVLLKSTAYSMSHAPSYCTECDLMHTVNLLEVCARQLFLNPPPACFCRISDSPPPVPTDVPFQTKAKTWHSAIKIYFKEKHEKSIRSNNDCNFIIIINFLTHNVAVFCANFVDKKICHSFLSASSFH